MLRQPRGKPAMRQPPRCGWESRDRSSRRTSANEQCRVAQSISAQRHHDITQRRKTERPTWTMSVDQSPTHGHPGLQRATSRLRYAMYIKLTTIALGIFGILVGLAAVPPALADDTEIFMTQFSGTGVSGGRPKVLILFDNSGSMRNGVEHSKPDYDVTIDWTDGRLIPARPPTSGLIESIGRSTAIRRVAQRIGMSRSFPINAIPQSCHSTRPGVTPTTYAYGAKDRVSSVPRSLPNANASTARERRAVIGSA